MRKVYGLLEVTLLADPPTTRLLLEGEIDELSDGVVEIAEGIAGPVQIDLGGVRRINSVGVRTWVRLLRRLRGNRAGIVLQRCSEPMVAALNLILEARAPVESVLAPYDCPACDQRRTSLLRTDQLGARVPSGQQPPAAPCPDCGREMSFDDDPERYFFFLQLSRTPLPPP